MEQGERLLRIVEPIGGRWIWPFTQMEVGDYFLVSHEDRDPEKVRHMAAVRAAQLGKRFSTEKWCEKHPGFTKVVRRPDIAPGSVEREEIDYGSLRDVVQRCYRLDINEMAWTLMDEGQRDARVAERLELPRQPVHCVRIDFATFIVELAPAGIVVQRVATNETLKGWKDKQVSAMLD
jgi:hypothetical protein